MKKKTHRDYGITDETMKGMWEFFMKTTIPRNAKKRMEEERKEQE